MRISTTTLESYRLFMQQGDQEWMTEADLIATIRGEFTPNHKINLGQAFGRVLEDPDAHLVVGGFAAEANGERVLFSRETVEPCLALIDRRGVFEAKGVKQYDEVDVVAKADHLLGSHLSEFKATLGYFDVTKYMESCQWRFMADIFQPTKITYHIFCLEEIDEHTREIGLRGIESFNLFPYAGLHEDCCELLREFCGYVRARGLDAVLRERQAAAVTAA